MLWGYLGPAASPPVFPEIEAFAVPETSRYITKMSARGNYAQLQEGDIDSSHVAFLHRRFDGAGVGGGRIDPNTFQDTQPRWFTAETSYGLQLAAQRSAGPDRFHWRINQFLMPYAVQIATPPGVPVLTQVRVPVDDAQSLHFRYWSIAGRPLSAEELAVFRDGVTVPELIPGSFLLKEDMANEYLLDRNDQKHSSYTGIRSFVAQDLAVTQDQGGFGTIADRSREYLTSSDKAIIAGRQRLIASAKALANGIEPTEAANPQAYNVRPGDFMLARDTPVDAGAKNIFAFASARPA